MFKNTRRIWQNLKPEEKGYLKAGFFWICLIGLFGVWVLPLLLTQFSFIDYSKTGEIGDTIGGISNPFIGLLTAILTFLAFYVQYQANKQQRRQFEDSLEEQKRQFQLNLIEQSTKNTRDSFNQYEESKKRDSVWQIERFENRFFELLKTHKDNTSEMVIENRVFGRRCFVTMFREFKLVYNLIGSYSIVEPTDTEEQVDTLSLAYKIFFYGIGPSSELNYSENLNKREKLILSKFIEGSKPKETYLLGPQDDSKPLDDEFNIPYKTFEGHMHRLAHYFRHLFHTAKYVVTASFLDDKQKDEYITILRTHLSNYEQLLLYYNSRCWFGKDWYELFTKYRLIKNLPIGLANGLGESPLIYFKDAIAEYRANGIEIFEFGGNKR